MREKYSAARRDRRTTVRATDWTPDPSGTQARIFWILSDCVCCSPCLCSPLGSRFSATSGETPNNFNISLNSSFIEFPDPSSSDLRLFKRLRPGGNPVRFESRDNGFICEALELLLALDEGTLLSPNNISGRTTERPPGFGLDWMLAAWLPSESESDSCWRSCEYVLLMDAEINSDEMWRKFLYIVF